MKTQTAFRLEKTLLDALKEEAKRQNRSLNNYVEFVLSKIIESKSHNTTLKAIEEVRKDTNIKTIEEQTISKLLESSEKDIENNDIFSHEYVVKEIRSKYGL